MFILIISFANYFVHLFLFCFVCFVFIFCLLFFVFLCVMYCFVLLLQIDLVPPEVVTAWKHYFTSKFEKLRVVCFTSFPKDENERNKDPSKGTIINFVRVLNYRIKIITLILTWIDFWWYAELFSTPVLSKRRRRKRCFFPVGPRALLEACENLRGDKGMMIKLP